MVFAILSRAGDLPGAFGLGGPFVHRRGLVRWGEANNVNALNLEWLGAFGSALSFIAVLITGDPVVKTASQLESRVCPGPDCLRHLCFVFVFCLSPDTLGQSGLWG